MALIFHIGITIWDWLIFIFIVLPFHYSVRSVKRVENYLINLINTLYQKISQLIDALWDNPEHVSRVIIKKMTDFFQVFLESPVKGVRMLVGMVKRIMDSETLFDGRRSQKNES
jgi:hypothetical protein